jgi:NAD-dependent SIR2 family protein deacetylase
MALILTIVIGLSLLIAVATITGRADADARKAGWRRLAAARRHHNERVLALHGCLDQPRCDACPVNRAFGPGH